MNSAVTVDHYRYDPGNLIGRGSFSKVYRGEDLLTDLPVAIKRIELSNMPEGLQARVSEELAIVKDLNHNNVVKIHNVYMIRSPESIVYIVMEYCSGGDFNKYLTAIRGSTGPMKESKVQHYIRQLAIGLHYLRNRSIVHRDLKPANLLLSADLCTLKIADFGFAKVLDEEKMTQTYCGSPYYMAPEILSGNPYSINTDLWSVGIIIYECIYSKLPFSGIRNMNELAGIVRTQAIIFPAQVPVSRACLDLMNNLLNKDPSTRYSWEQFFEHPWINDTPFQSFGSLSRSASSFTPILSSHVHSLASRVPTTELEESSLSETSFTSLSGSSVTVTINTGVGKSAPVTIPMIPGQTLSISFTPTLVPDYLPEGSPLLARSDPHFRSQVNQSPERRPRPPEPLAESYGSLFSSMVSSVLSPFSIFGKKP